ncbi:Benzoyl-CoA reductase subunit BadG [Clostridiaceae bacterium JG1575]|nr:Benzoyl-CoA reductase subunit BadG [Clostridiaceae bacterium JG1575]
MIGIGVDLGSTAAKVAVLGDDGALLDRMLLPTGWNARDTAQRIETELRARSFLDQGAIVSTGYGRVSVPFAQQRITEISCHAKGVDYLFPGVEATVLDIGGQDTKVIHLREGTVSHFAMNDKCSAGTGRFLEVMADSMGLSLEELFDLAQKGRGIPISSLCTVFAQSEIIGLIGKGADLSDIAAGVLGSIVQKVATLAKKQGQARGQYLLTGGFSDNAYMCELLAKELRAPVGSHPLGRYAGALGAAVFAKELN